MLEVIAKGRAQAAKELPLKSHYPQHETSGN